MIMMNGGCATNIMSALYDHAKQYDDEHTCHKTERWRLQDNISQNGYGNAMIGRYGGCFDEAREECDWFQDTKGFSANWSREVGYCCKNATTDLTTVRCRSDG